MARLPDGMSNEELRADPELRESYGELFAMFPDHPVELHQGVLRWVANPMVKWIEQNVDLNAMKAAFLRGKFSLEDWAKFQCDTGWSLSGYKDSVGPHLKLRGVNSYEEINSALRGPQV